MKKIISLLLIVSILFCTFAGLSVCSSALDGKVSGFKCKARTAAAEALIWNKIGTASGYQIQISNPAGSKWVATKATTSTAYVFKNLTAGSNYKFRIRYYVKGNNGEVQFSSWSSTLCSPTLPKSTALTKLAAGVESFTAQWGKQAVTGYQLQYSTNAQFTGAKTLTFKNVNVLKATVKKLIANKTYYVRVRTYKYIAKANYFSTWSPVRIVVPKIDASKKAVYITPTGKRYHYDSKCGNGTYIKVTLREALNRGLTPCKKCVHG